MKKAKLVGLLSAPIVFTSLPLFSTSCTSTSGEEITLKDETKVTSREELENFQVSIYEKYLQGKTKVFATPTVAHTTESISDEGLVGDFKSEFTALVLRQAAL